jgi:hypothetical protein
MAEGDGFIMNNFKHQVMEGIFNLLSANLRVCLIHGAAPILDTDTCLADIIDQEVAGTGYTTKGELVGTPAVTLDAANDRGKFDGDNVTWTGLLLTTPADAIPDWAVLYDDGITTPSADMLIAYWTVTTVTNGGNYTLAWHADGIILLT